MADSSSQNASYWTTQLNLQPHPEGGYYKEFFRSLATVHRTPYKNTVPIEKVLQAITSIYYLLEGDDYSGFHRISSDEVWYFHKGAPLHIHVIDKQGAHLVLELSDTSTGNLSVVVTAGLWFAAEVPSKGFTLVSCAVAPGFEFSEFEMAKEDNLTALYPQHRLLFVQLCRS